MTMPNTESTKRKKQEAARAKRTWVDTDSPQADMGPRPFPSEAKMLASLESAHERRMSATANNRPSSIPTSSREPGPLRHKKADY